MVWYVGINIGFNVKLRRHSEFLWTQKTSSVDPPFSSPTTEHSSAGLVELSLIEYNSLLEFSPCLLRSSVWMNNVPISTFSFLWTQISKPNASCLICYKLFQFYLSIYILLRHGENIGLIFEKPRGVIENITRLMVVLKNGNCAYTKPHITLSRDIPAPTASLFDLSGG